MAGAFIISLDFELHWGLRDHVTVDEYRDALLGVRRAVPAMLALFEQHEVHATWATVGMLLFDGREDLRRHMPAPEDRPGYRTAELSPYAALDELGDDEAQDPFHFAPSLVRDIVKTPGQELGTHTFSHYYCLEEGQNEQQFGADLRAAMRVAEDRFGVRTQSIVFPRNQVKPGYLRQCRQAGLRSFRGNQAGWMHAAGAASTQTPVRRAARLVDSYVDLSGLAAPRQEEGLVDLPASAFLRPYSTTLARLERLRQARLRASMEAAARTGGVFHLWWHPHNFGRRLGQNLETLAAVLADFDRLRREQGMVSLTMAEAAERFYAERPQQERAA